MQQVERIKLDGGGSSLDRRLERLEAGLPIRVQHDRLAVDQRRADRERSRVVQDGLELLAPIEPRARKGMASPPGDAQQAPIAVELHLVQPAITGRDMIDQCRELHRLERRRRQTSHFSARPSGRRRPRCSHGAMLMLPQSRQE